MIQNKKNFELFSFSPASHCLTNLIMLNLFLRNKRNEFSKSHHHLFPRIKVRKFNLESLVCRSNIWMVTCHSVLKGIAVGLNHNEYPPLLRWPTHLHWATITREFWSKLQLNYCHWGPSSFELFQLTPFNNSRCVFGIWNGMSDEMKWDKEWMEWDGRRNEMPISIDFIQPNTRMHQNGKEFHSGR